MPGPGRSAVDAGLGLAGKDGAKMSDIDSVLAAMQITRADHLPIMAAFCRRIGLVRAVNGVAPTEMAVDVGTVMEAMVLDTLSGRSPLYRLAEFFEHQDTTVLLGRHIARLGTGFLWLQQPRRPTRNHRLRLQRQRSTRHRNFVAYVQRHDRL